MALLCLVILALSPMLIAESGYLQNADPSAGITNGAISVVTEPAGAETFLDGKSTGSHTPCLLAEIPPGIHRVMVWYPCYENKSGFVTVSEGKTAEIRFNLTQTNCTYSLPGAMNSGYSGYSSGSGRGTTTGPAYPPHGDSAPGTDPGSILTPPGDSVPGTDPGSVIPPPDSGSAANGSIRVGSTPQGAEIFLDGQDTLHVTPFSFREITVGNHEVGVTLSGYETPPLQVKPVISGAETGYDFVMTAAVSPDPAVTPVPEFPSLAFPAMTIILVAFIVYGIRVEKKYP
jgi:hypothetical protein